ncbi:MAG TPA: HAD family hydrolase [Dongiaceae bacterium]|nr:HAD family hydrolase [Dongiaceae bacterium]
MSSDRSIDRDLAATPISLVIFDCDGVLIDSELISTAVMVEMLRPLGVAIDQRHVLEHFVGHPYPVVAGKIAASHGAPLPSDFESSYRSALIARFAHELTAMPGIVAVLDALAVPFCAATSSAPERARESLRIAGLARHFGERVYTVSMVARAKPAPDLFLLAAQRMGVDPARCLVVEDSPLGIAAARAAGMKVWQFTGGGHFAAAWKSQKDVPPPDRSFSDMADFFATAPHLRR